MRDKTLTGLILFFALAGVIAFFVGHGDLGVGEDEKYIARYIFMVAFGVTPILLMMKLVSRFFLKGLDWMRLSTLEGVFMIYYFFLTKEAREEWRACINRKKLAR